MEWNPETLQFLSQCFLHTLSPEREARRRAEASLLEASDRPNYGLAVLRLVAELAIDEQIRQAAAVNFKNHLKGRWAPASSDEAHSSLIPDGEKEQIKALIVTLMLSASPRIQSQLSEALAVIGKHDFPKAWPALLPELISNLQKALEASDYTSINGILGAIETKLTAVASTRLICESPSLLDAAAVEHWGKMLDSIVTLLSRPEQDRVEEEPEMPDIAESGYTATFVRLFSAGKKEEDPLTDIKDPKEFLVASLAKLSALYPGRFIPIISQYLDQANQAALLELCRFYNCPIV